MELYGVRVFVDDLAAARAFYGATLGLPVAWESEGAVGFSVGAAVLIVEREDPGGPEGHLVGRFVGVSLAVADIGARYEELRGRGVAFAVPPELQPWGGTLAHFHDPAGNTLTLLG